MTESLPGALPSLPVPTELVVHIFQSLNSLYDCFSLAATSRTLRHIWLEHAGRIYLQVAPKCVEGEKHARQLQLVISGNKDVTSDDILGIMHRARFVDTIIPQFEQKVVSKVRATWLKCYYNNAPRPKHLTITEQRRFIRTYYQLWTFIPLDESSWQATMDAFSIKQIYLLREMCRIPLPIGDDLPGPELMREWPHYWDSITEDRRGRLGSALQRRITEYVKRRNSPSCDDDPWFIRPENRSEGYAGFHLLWDHGKPGLYELSMARPKAWPVELPQEEAEYERKHYWAESSDEEDLLDLMADAAEYDRVGQRREND